MIKSCQMTTYVSIIALSRIVPFLHGKSFSRVKSFFRAVKCFSIRDPFAPRVDLYKPSQARAAKGHSRCKWITHGKTFHSSEKWFHSGKTFPVEKRNIYTFLFSRDSWPKTPYVKSIGYWVLMCYVSVFACLLEYCIVLTFKKPCNSNQIGTTTESVAEEQKRIRIALTIEKFARICVPLYLFLFISLYFIIMTL